MIEFQRKQLGKMEEYQIQVHEQMRHTVAESHMEKKVKSCRIIMDLWRTSDVKVKFTKEEFEFAKRSNRIPFGV